MFVADPELTILEVNEAAVRLTGYPRDEMVGSFLPKLIPAEELAARPLRLAELHSGRRVESERRIRRADGTLIVAEFSVRQLADGRVFGVVRDVSQRRANEKRLRLLSRALEVCPAAMLITDPSGVIEYVNPRFTQITGWSLAEAAGKTPAVLKSGQTPAATYREMWEAIRGGSEWRGEIINRRRNGEIFPWVLSIHPVFDEGGRIDHFLGVGEDATERRATERTLEETRNELYQARKMEALGRLAGGVAHDFNNLLGVILGYSELLSATLPEGSEGREQLGEVGNAVKRAADLTRQLLAFSRRQVLAVRVVDLSTLLEESRKMLARLLPESIEFRLVIEPDLWSVRADATQLVQVLVNLAVNSRDAMPLGGLLEIGARNVVLGGDGAAAHGLEAGDYVCLSVRDSGVGMTPDIRERAFEPFFTTKEAAGGSGLGLATVYGIVQQLGGCVEIDSAPARGTAFTLFVPRSTVKASGEHALALPSESQVLQQRILVVEDLAPLRKLVEQMLLRLGYQVVTAASAREALDIAGEAGVEIDVLLSDIVMPGMDGRELARLLKTARPKMHVILMTGYSDLLADLTDPRELGADAVVQKPFSRSDIARTLSEVLSGPSSDGEVR